MGQREREIRKVARVVLAEAGVTTAPIDPFAVAAAKSIRLEERDGFPDGVYGAMYQHGQGFGILISSRCFGTRHRAFTLAHELGHYHIDGHIEGMFAEGAGQVLSMGGHFRSQRDPVEREADWFASELLMPEDLVRERVEPLDSSVASIQELAEDFKVSLSCAGIRFCGMTDEACAVVLSKNGEIEWMTLSPRVREHRWSHKQWKMESVPPHALSRELSKDPETDGPKEREGLASEWFQGAPGKLGVIESSLLMPQYGRVFSVLTLPDLLSVDEEHEELEATDWRKKDWRDSLRGYELD